MKIFKYTLEVAELQTVKMPFGAKILCLQMQDDMPTVWTMVEDGNSLVDRKIAMVATGQELPDVKNSKYIGTVLMCDGLLVWHYFDVGE